MAIIIEWLITNYIFTNKNSATMKTKKNNKKHGELISNFLVDSFQLFS